MVKVLKGLLIGGFAGAIIGGIGGYFLRITIPILIKGFPSPSEELLGGLITIENIDMLIGFLLGAALGIWISLKKKKIK